MAIALMPEALCSVSHHAVLQIHLYCKPEFLNLVASASVYGSELKLFYFICSTVLGRRRAVFSHNTLWLIMYFLVLALQII